MPVAIPKLSASDKKKAYMLLGLVGLLVVVMLWNGVPWPKRAAAPPVASTPKDGRVKNSQLARQPSGVRRGESAEPTFGPIAVLPPIVQVSAEATSNARNVFAYPPPPVERPKPPPPKFTPPPPTINLGAVSPSTAFAGTPRPVTVTLAGSLFPIDARVTMNGQAVSAQRISANVIKVTVGASDLANPGVLSFEIRSSSQPKQLWSAPAKLQVVPSPDPAETFVYSGRVGAQAVITFKDDRRPKLVAVNDVLNAAVPWRVMSVTDKQVELLDTRNDIRKLLPLAPKGAK